MKQLRLLAIALVLGLSSFAQTTAENNVIKLTYIGFTNGNHSIELKNKGNCPATARFDDGTKQISYSLSPLEAKIIQVPGVSNQIKTIKAKRTSGGECIRNASESWIQIETPYVLPIIFKAISAVRLDQRTFRLTFESEEDNTIQKYVIKLSTDGKNYKDVNIVFPDGIVGSKKYTVTVKL